MSGIGAAKTIEIYVPSGDESWFSACDAALRGISGAVAKVLDGFDVDETVEGTEFSFFSLAVKVMEGRASDVEALKGAWLRASEKFGLDKGPHLRVGLPANPERNPAPSIELVSRCNNVRFQMAAANCKFPPEIGEHNQYQLCIAFRFNPLNAGGTSKAGTEFPGVQPLYKGASERLEAGLSLDTCKLYL